ncbi:MAG: N-acetylgalactosamine 6-sulfate sulfatase [Lentisphaerae bacterium]|nr:MAG: N-acetylgalactosamine 6-sulfate sulfatase [Lentisphaerota bacterium]
MIRKTFWTATACSSVFALHSPSSHAANRPPMEKPNLIVIMADDLGYADVGFNGCKDIPTPNIDSIAQKGVKFTNGYTSYSVCSPSRAGFLTGRYQQRFGHERNPQFRPKDPNMGLPRSEMTIAGSLGKVGYICGLIGKWHLGAHPTLLPLQRGFHYFYGFPGGGHIYLPQQLTNPDPFNVPEGAEEWASYKTWLLRNNTPVKPKQYLTDEFSDDAVRFVERNKDRPFFLFLAYNAPHTPLQATEKYLTRFAHITDKKRRTYAAMVSAIDDGVGKLLKKVRELGLEKNTIIFFLSDNGGPEPKNASDNGPLRGTKGTPYEGGYRVPFAVQWEGVIPHQVYDHPVSSLDIFATISAITNSPTRNPLDGVNLLPYLTGQKKTPPHEAIYLRMFDRKAHAVRVGDFKLLTWKNGEIKQLYNLKEDLGETRNVAQKYPEVTEKLETLRKAWDAQLIEPRFLGLIHTKAWAKKRQKRHPKKKPAQAQP